MKPTSDDAHAFVSSPRGPIGPGLIHIHNQTPMLAAIASFLCRTMLACWFRYATRQTWTNRQPSGQPIGLFPTTIRVWFSVRLVTVKI